MQKGVSVCIAGIRVRMRAARGEWRYRLDAAYEAFLEAGEGPPEVSIVVSEDPPPSVQGRLVFASGSLWRFYDDNGEKWIVTLVPHRRGVVEDRVAIFTEDFRKGRVYLAPEFLQGQSAQTRGAPGGQEIPARFPLGYPLDELLFIHLLSLGRGMEVHACGVNLGGRGLLFAGVSGAGKSTIARLISSEPDVRVLSDDRIIIRSKNGRPCIYGTPWHGSGRAFAAEGVSLSGIFFLRHAPTNECRAVPRTAAAASLVARSFPTYWDRRGLEFTLRFADEVTAATPVYDFGFAPTPACVEFLRHFLNR